MITKTLIDRIFNTASISRWNEFLHPIELTELDKHAHRAMIAFILAKTVEEKDGKYDWTSLIECIVFELLEKSVLTDIQRPVFDAIKSSNPQFFKDYVVSNLSYDILKLHRGEVFYEHFIQYLERRDDLANTLKLLEFASFLATQTELDLVIAPFNTNSYNFENVKREFDMRNNKLLLRYDDVLIENDNALGKFVKYCSQLRYQIRWAQTPRIPRTSVLSHSMLVAALVFLVCFEQGAKEKRLYANFFTALFHDLPELLTRDIISPIKKSVHNLADKLKEIEVKLLQEKIYPLLSHHKSMQNDIKLFIENEFANVCIDENNNIITDISNSDMQLRFYNNTSSFCRDGRLIKVFDEFSAMLEAHFSIEYGISSKELYIGKQNILKKYLDPRRADFFDSFANTEEERNFKQLWQYLNNNSLLYIFEYFAD